MRSPTQKKILIAFFVLLIFFVMLSQIDRSFLHPENVRLVVESYGVAGPLIFVFFYALVVLFFLPATPMSLLGGAIFGPYMGTLWIVLGASIGAILAFILARFFGEKLFQKILEKYAKSLVPYQEGLVQKGFLTVLLLRLIPLFPFNGLNFALGISGVKTRDYIFATALGIIPGALAYASVGEVLAMPSWGSLLMALPRVLIVFAIILVYTILRRGKSPTEKNTFDVIVVGAGSGGLNVASFMNRAGFKTLLVTKTEEDVGGDCLNTGCVPSKAFIHVARTIASGRDAEQFGFSQEGNTNIEKVMAYVREAQGKFRPHENVDWFRSQGMTVVVGKGQFAGRDTVGVEGVLYKGKKIVLATGSRPRTLNLPGLDNVLSYTNETIFSMSVFPKQFVFIGGGPISLELGQAFQRFGSSVTIVHGGERILEKEDPRVSEWMKEKLTQDGVRILTRAKPLRVENQTLVVEEKDGKAEHIPFDAIFLGVGRVLNTDGLELKKAGIEVDDHGGIQNNDYLETANPNILVCGDVAGRHLFTHAAEVHAALIIENFFRPLKKKLQTDHMAWVTYTTPEVATFGFSESELKRQRMKYSTTEGALNEDDRAMIDGDNGFERLFIGTGGKILGGTIVAGNAGEIVEELILANTYGIPAKHVFRKVYPYPTASRITRRVLGKYLGERLTKRTKRLLRYLYS